MLYRLTEHIITQVVAKEMVPFAVSSICIFRQGQRKKKAASHPLSAFSFNRANRVLHFPHATFFSRLLNNFGMWWHLQLHSLNFAK